MSLEEKSKLYIVVAHDDLDIHQKIKTALNQGGIDYIITSVYNGQQLIHLLLKQGFYKTDTFRKPDLIILDLKMQVIDGFAALETISSQPNLKDMNVQVLIDGENEEQLQRVKKLGASGVLNKPLNLDSLIPSLKKICNSLPTV